MNQQQGLTMCIIAPLVLCDWARKAKTLGSDTWTMDTPGPPSKWNLTRHRAGSLEAQRYYWDDFLAKTVRLAREPNYSRACSAR